MPAKRTGRPSYLQTLPLRFPPADRSPPFRPVSFFCKWNCQPCNVFDGETTEYIHLMKGLRACLKSLGVGLAVYFPLWLR